ncbi:MAG: hypothetical protein IID41_11950 [Planctomycetes bacterium]|nr:hypothetical protein [Planctomycetota bacterium]
MPTKSSTHDGLATIAKWLNETADHLPQRNKDCGPLTLKLTDCELESLQEQGGDLQSRMERRNAQKRYDEWQDTLCARGQLLNQVGVATGKRIVLAMQAGALSEYAKLIRDTMSTWANSHEDQLYNAVFLLMYNHVLPSRDQLSELELRPDGLSTEAERYVRALRMLSELIQPAEAPPPAGLAQVKFPSPSVPMTKSKAADKYGGDMTVDKLTSQMASGRVKYLELNRQMFIFCCDDVPNLEPAHKTQPRLAETARNTPKLPK